MPAPVVINRLPLISSLLKWFKGDELTIDNLLFKLHHQVRGNLQKKRVHLKTLSKLRLTTHPPTLFLTNYFLTSFEVLISTHPTYLIFDKNIAKKTAFFNF